MSVERDQVPPATSVQSGIATEPSVNPGVPLIPSVSFWDDVTFPWEMCGSACKLDRLRIASKKQGTYKCKRCLTRYSMLQRTLGSWPPPFWGSTTEEQKYQFWKSPGTTNGELCSEPKRLESQVESNMKYNNPFEAQLIPRGGALTHNSFPAQLPPSRHCISYHQQLQPSLYTVQHAQPTPARDVQALLDAIQHQRRAHFLSQGFAHSLQRSQTSWSLFYQPRDRQNVS